MELSSEARRERLLWIATYILAALPLLGWWLYGLFDLDEGFYAAVTGSMLRTGDWITPHYNGQPWFEKPILLYWLAAPFVAVFGESIGPRMPSIFANLATYALVGSFVARRLSPTAGRWTVIALATSPMIAVLGRMMMTDAIFVFCLTWSFLALYRSFADGWKWRALSGAALGLAVLAKGPVAIVLWILLMAAVAWRQPQLRRNAFELGSNLAALLTLSAVVSIWYLPAYLVNGDVFVQRFLIDQNIGRFTGGDKAHAVPWYLHLPYYFVVLGLGMVPWSWRIMEGWPKKIEIGESGSTFLHFCAHWAIVVLVFFTLSGSKLPHYILPTTIPVAILCARTLQSPLFGFGTLVWGIILAIGLNVAGIVYYQQSGQEEAHRLARWIRARGGSVAAYQLPRRQRDLGTGKPKLQETSLPSLSHYLNRDLVQVENLTDLIGREPIWIFTRKGRISGLDQVRMIRLGFTLERELGPVPQENYEVFRLERRMGLPVESIEKR